MSEQIIQNKGPKKMGHMGMQKPHINTDNTMAIGDTGIGPMSPTSTKQFSDSNSPMGNDMGDAFGAPYLSDNEPLKEYSNKFMEKKIPYMNNNEQFSHINYNIEPLKMGDTGPLMEGDMNKSEMTGYDNLFSNFDNYGNNRDISLVNSDMINTFQNRFIKNSNNKLEHDIDATGSSVSNKINGSNLNNLDTFHSVN